MFKKDDAINDDVSVDEEVETVEEDQLEEPKEERPKSQREIMMEQVYSKRIDDLNKELEQGGAPKVGEEPKEKEETKPDVPETITVKVDGVETTLTREEFDKQVREYQKHKAADKRLEEAAKKMKELEKLEATLKAQSEKKREEESNEKDDIDVSTLDGYDDLFEEFVTQIREGNDKDAVQATKEFAKALKKMLPKSSSSANVDEQVRKELEKIREAETAEAEAEAERKSAQEVETAKEMFNKTFEKEIEENSDFFDLAVMEDNKLMRDSSWADRPLRDRFLQAGENAKKWLRGKGTVDKTQEKKKNLRTDTNKTAVAGLKDRTEQESPMTPSQTIQEMKKARGQFY